MKRGIIMNQENIGKFIADLRKEKNMTQQELADKLNVTDRAISNWERGRRLPDISLLKELSNLFGVTIDEIICGRRIRKEEKDKLLEQNIIQIYTTRKKIENMQILTELLIFAGIVITITLTSILAKSLNEKIITLCIGSFVWLFGIILRILLRKIHNPFDNK
jgi:transcriptional regulator with XRE-family HTH domain